MHVAAIEVELHLPSAHSLKDKRQVVKVEEVLDGVDRWIWSHGEVEVVGVSQVWLDEP